MRSEQKVPDKSSPDVTKFRPGSSPVEVEVMGSLAEVRLVFFASAPCAAPPAAVSDHRAVIVSTAYEYIAVDRLAAAVITVVDPVVRGLNPDTLINRSSAVDVVVSPGAIASPGAVVSPVAS